MTFSNEHPIQKNFVNDQCQTSSFYFQVLFLLILISKLCITDMSMVCVCVHHESFVVFKSTTDKFLHEGDWNRSIVAASAFVVWCIPAPDAVETLDNPASIQFNIFNKSPLESYYAVSQQGFQHTIQTISWKRGYDPTSETKQKLTYRVHPLEHGTMGSCTKIDVIQQPRKKHNEGSASNED